MKIKTQNISQLIRQYIDQVDSTAEVILFGSRARGEENQASDWDLLILTDYEVNWDVEQAFRNKLYDLELEIGETLSVFVYSKHEWNTKQSITPFYENVLNEGVAL